MTWKLYAFHWGDGKPEYLESEADYDAASLQAVWEEAWLEAPNTLAGKVLSSGKPLSGVFERLVGGHGFRYPVPFADTADSR